MDTNTAAVDQKPPFIGAFDLFKPSINILKLNFWSFVALGFVPFLLVAIGMVMLMAGSSTNDTTREVVIEGASGSIGVLIATVGGILSLLVSPGYLILQIKGANGEKAKAWPAFKEGLRYFWRFIGVSILQSLIFMAALIALVVPFFFAYRRYLLAPYYVVGRDMHVMQALRQSAADSITYKSPMWGLVGVESLLFLLSAIPGLNYVMWIPQVLYACAPAHRFKEIGDAAKAEVSPADSLKEVL